MDLEFQELLTALDEDRDGFLNEFLQRMFTPVEGRLTAGRTVSPFNLASAKLIWLAAHYMSAPAASHSFEVAYLESSTEVSLDLYVPSITDLLPTSTILSVSCGENAEVRYYAGGGQQSNFEHQDLKFLSRDERLRNRACVLVINLSNSSADHGWLYDVVRQQVLLAYICVVRTAEQDCLFQVDESPTWRHTMVRLGKATVDVYRHLAWDQGIGQLQKFLFSSHDPLGEENEPYDGNQRVPVVAADQFPRLTITGTFPPETIAGPIIHIYNADGEEPCAYQKLRLPEFKTGECLFFEAQNVNVSGGDLIWNEGGCLFDAGMLTQYHIDPSVGLDYKLGGSVPVSAPSRALTGTYFLAPTLLKHHSHLMVETLRRFHLAERYDVELKLLILNTLSPSQRDYFHLFGFDDSKVVYHDFNETVSVERLIFSSEHRHRYERLSAEYFRRVGLKYYSQSHDKCERIYFSRRDARKYRNLVNELEVEDVFKSFGFQIVMASEITAEQKIDIMSTALYVAGPLGAALSYQAFSARAEMIVLSSSLYFPTQFLDLSALQARDVHYIKGLGLSFYNMPWRYEHSSFYVDTDMLRGALARILREPI